MIRLTKKTGLAAVALLTMVNIWGQTNEKVKQNAAEKRYWYTGTMLLSYRLPPPMPGQEPEYIDLDGDGDPDILRIILADGTPVQWIDDNDNMQYGDLEGDTDDDCLMIDRNRDGQYGGYGDLIIDWVSEDEDGNPAMQVVVDNITEQQKMAGSAGHYMWMIDTDKDKIFNYIDWSTYKLRCWIHNGQADFFEDYHGRSAFLKIHGTPERMNDVRMNWENPFLFYDPDNDGLTEMAIRLLDSPREHVVGDQKVKELTGNIDWVSISVDMDNDNAPGNEFDLDMTLHFTGPGFSYKDQRHTNKNLRGLPAADNQFLDPAWRQLTELLYPDHDSAWSLIFEQGKWDSATFTYDEDDDCNRWERVEFYQDRNAFTIGARKGGVDNNIQSDPAGDRGEWDRDNSGGGNLYVSPMDGKIHLYGAERGVWRIDQHARYYQGFGGYYDGYGKSRMWEEPEKFATIQYTDTDGNGFFDTMEFDLDGDTIFEERLSMIELGLDDRCEIIRTAGMQEYKSFTMLQKKVSEQTWSKALEAVSLAESKGLNTSWYALMKHPKSTREQYHHGFWLQFYLYKDLRHWAAQQSDPKEWIRMIDRAYLSGDWKLVH